MTGPSYYKHAINEKANLIGVGASLALACLLFTPIPVIVGAAAEAMYLIFVPDSRWYRRIVDARYEKEVAARRQAMKEQILKELPSQDRARFARLEELRERIHEGMSKQGQDVRSLMSSELRKLDYLLDSFLSFLSAHARYEAHLRDIRPGEVDAEIRQLTNRLSQETDDGVKKVLQQNLDLLNRRKEILDGVVKNMRVVAGQLDAIENTFELINDRVVSMKSPEQISADLQAVVENVDMTANVIEETAPLLEQAQKVERGVA